MDSDGELTIKQAAERAQLAPETMRNMRSTGRGPRSYRRSGRVWITERDLDEWMAARAQTSSTRGGLDAAAG